MSLLLLIAPMEDSETNDIAVTEQVNFLTLGIAPVEFSGQKFSCGRFVPDESRSVKDLRKEYGHTHAFRFDSRDKKIANVSLRPDVEPMGDVSDANVAENLLLLAEALNVQLRRWLARSRRILRKSRPLVALGRRDWLLAKALSELNITNPDYRLDVCAKWSFDFRLLFPADPDGIPWLGLVADVGTSTVIDLPVKELLERGFDPSGFYVGIRQRSTDSFGPATFAALRTSEQCQWRWSSS